MYPNQINQSLWMQGLFNFFCAIVTEHNFVCLTQREAKQIEILEFGAEKVLLQDQAKRTGSSCSKTLNSPMVFGEKFL